MQPEVVAFGGHVQPLGDIKLTCPGPHRRSHSVRCVTSSEVCLRSESHLQGATPLSVPPTSFAWSFLQTPGCRLTAHTLTLSQVLREIWPPIPSCPGCYFQSGQYLCLRLLYIFPVLLNVSPDWCSAISRPLRSPAWSHRRSTFPSNCSSGVG